VSKTSVTSESGVTLNIGMSVLVYLDNHGVFLGAVDHFEQDGAVAVIMPTRDLVRDVFPIGYQLGQAHWKTMLGLVAGQPW